MKPKSTTRQLDTELSQIQDLYQNLEYEVFKNFIKRLKSIKNFEDKNILEWQLLKMSEMHLLNEENIKLVSETTKIAESKINKLIKDNGYSIAVSESKRLDKALRRRNKKPDRSRVDQVLTGLIRQVFGHLDNYVNQTLITTNFGKNEAMKVYEKIITETTSSVVAGIKTRNKALNETIYKWREKGLKSGFVDKGGHHWNMRTYADLVINQTSRKANQQVRDDQAHERGIHTFEMSSRPQARKSCAHIQGKVICDIPRSEYTEKEANYPSIYEHGYPKPSGCFGINCHHQKWGFVPGVNTLNKYEYEPEEAIENGKDMARQRRMERAIRSTKDRLDMAEILEDEEEIILLKSKIRGQQKAIREYLKEKPLLKRDYSREKI